MRNYYFDYERFRKYSSALSPRASATARLARVTKAYHMLEKGLALPQPRPGFGRGYADEPVGFLLEEVPLLETDGLAGLESVGARSAMREYVHWHDARGHDLDDRVRSFAAGCSQGPGGTVRVSRTEILDRAAVNFEAFTRSRYSIRNFTGEAVSEESIRSAVAVALKSPRVCNRESRRVYAALDSAKRELLLAQQNGNRGFGHLAGAVLVITSELGSFIDFGERNQCWVDGGLFSMTLAYALHAQGLGTCMLNACNTSERDREIHRRLGISDSEVIVMFLAVGHIPESLSVAASPSPTVDQILKLIG
jgi:nitroreductase